MNVKHLATTLKKSWQVFKFNYKEFYQTINLACKNKLHRWHFGGFRVAYLHVFFHLVFLSHELLEKNSKDISFWGLTFFKAHHVRGSLD